MTDKPDKPRLIERAFPLKQTSLASVHEKNVRHGHISTLHIWPARRPLAACRAALLATLLPDPGTPEERQKLCERIGGKVKEKIERKRLPNGRIEERAKEEADGGILKWIGVEPKSGGRLKMEQHRADVEFRENELAWFREQIRKEFGGRAPRVLDPFAGGGAIPLEAMRLGCEATAIDINPVAWFILKCTLEYPQKLAGKTYPLPNFILEDEDFMETFYKAHPDLIGKTKKTKRQKEDPQRKLWGEESSDRAPEADLAWHVRAWGRWVLNRARKELAQYYPTYADFEPIDLKHPYPYEKKPMSLVPLKEDGTADIDALNADFPKEYLDDKRNPRWVAKPTVAYLWARTVKCKNCRAHIPLIKTRWLCKKSNKRVLLMMEPKIDKSGVDFEIDRLPNRYAEDKRNFRKDEKSGHGTMSRAGAKCPFCGSIMTMEDIRAESAADRTDIQMTALVLEGQKTKEYKKPSLLDRNVASHTNCASHTVTKNLHRISLNEPFEPASTRSITAQLYGVKRWQDLFTTRQRLSIIGLGSQLRSAYECMSKQGVPSIWKMAIVDCIALALDRIIGFMCVNTRWKTDADSLTDAFSRFSISLLWDFAEANPLGTTAGGFIRCVERIATAYELLLKITYPVELCSIIKNSAAEFELDQKYDVVITDPPYYQAVSYADLSDFFYTWLRGFIPRDLEEFKLALSDKKKEFVQHIRNDKSREEEKEKYENQMASAFIKIRSVLSDRGRFVCVFAHKEPDAWETLVSAIIKAGFVVTGSWPIQTEMPSRQRGSGVAALASSVWLICRPRLPSTRIGWDNRVLEKMRQKIQKQLREYWDAGIRGPDFVWAATGPALEAYSKHPIVKKANNPGELMTVGEFLSHVRRMVVDFVVGQVLTGEKRGSDMAAADSMDAPTAYYLLHRHDFGMEQAPAGACILYATACGLSDGELETTWNLVSHKGNVSKMGDKEADPDDETQSTGSVDSSSKILLKTWAQRKRHSMGYESPSGRPIPLIDRVHRLMHLWRAGDKNKLDEYLDDNGLRRHELFKRLLQSLIELSNPGSEERSLLESLSNHIQIKGAQVLEKQRKMEYGGEDAES